MLVVREAIAAASSEYRADSDGERASRLYRCVRLIAMAAEVGSGWNTAPVRTASEVGAARRL